MKNPLLEGRLARALRNEADNDSPKSKKKQRAKTNAERGQAFRARQDQYMNQLTLQNEELQEEIQTLSLRNTSWKTHVLHSKHSLNGSLVQLIYEYHRLFKHGLPDKETARSVTTLHRIERQEAFLRQVIDPSAMVANLIGPEVSIEQWRRYTLAHAHMDCAIERVEIVGPNENPTLIIHIPLYARISIQTFQMMFPHALHNHALVSKLIDRVIKYDAVKYYQFTSDGCISMERVDVSFISGLLAAGCSISEVQTLMTYSPITVDSTISNKA